MSLRPRSAPFWMLFVLFAFSASCRTEVATRREQLPGGNWWTMFGVLLTTGTHHPAIRVEIVCADSSMEGGGTVDLTVSELARDGRVVKEVETAWRP